jgi:glycosyltransferase involved in cell wall biosynthesis
VVKRVLCCSGSLEGGGSERQLWQLAIGLEPQRFATEIFLLYRRGLYLAQVPPRIPIHDFWSSHDQTHFFWPGQIRSRQIQQLVRTIRERQIDIVYDRTFHMTLLTAAACRRTHTPRISVIVSPPSLDFMRSPERFRWLKKRLLSQAYRDPLCLPVTVSSAVADDAASFYGVPRQRFTTLPSPIDIAAVAKAALPELPHWPHSDNLQEQFRLVVVGRLSAEKGQSLALQALAQFKAQLPAQNVQLTIVGDGPDRPALEQLVQHLSLEGYVHFTGRIDNPYPWMRGAHLLCIPSLYEGLPNVALEAMCLGTPVVSTRCSGSVQELLGDNLRGMLTPIGDAPALAAAMRQRLETPDLWNARTVAATQWVGAHHALEPWLVQMQRLLEQWTEARNRS